MSEQTPASQAFDQAKAEANLHAANIGHKFDGESWAACDVHDLIPRDEKVSISVDGYVYLACCNCPVVIRQAVSS